MTAYRGPHVAVEQTFETSPGAVAIENLPPAIAASAFDIFAEEALDTWYGILGASSGVETPWEVDGVTIDKVVYDKDVIDQRAYDFYPVNVYASSQFGNIELDKEDKVSSDGITFYKDDVYDVPDTEKVVGSCTGVLPYYKSMGSLVTILEANKSTVIITNGAIVTAQIKPGQHVFVTSDAGTSWTLVGVVGSIGTDETKIHLASAYSAAIAAGNGIAVGCAPETNATIALNTLSDTLYDANADFIAAKVKVGDLVNITSLSLSSEIVASVRSIINANTIKFNTVTQTRPDDYFTQYKISAAAPGVTVAASTYSITRFVGFSQNYGLEILEDEASVKTGVVIKAVDTVNYLSFKIPSIVQEASQASSSSSSLNSSSSSSESSSSERSSSSSSESSSSSSESSASSGSMSSSSSSLSLSSESSSSSVYGDTVPALSAGDVIMITSTNDDSISEANMTPYKIDTITFDGTDYTITSQTHLYRSCAGTVNIANGDYLHAWHPELESSVAADFRAVRSEENQVVKRISSPKDITNAWCSGDEIDVHNELAFMALSAFNTSGGKVCYGINADATASSISTEYAACLEELKLYDVYSHCLGTTDAGVNALMSAYCDGQADPYEGHERVAVLAYDEDDAYLMGTDTGTSAASGVITLTGGTFNPLTAGLTVGDTVDLFDSDGDLVGSANVTETPTTLTSIQTDGILTTGVSFNFLSGRKDDQANRIALLGAITNRRNKVVWPSYFYAEVDNTRYLLPPYYIAANICGEDSGVIVSQSFTRKSFTPSGMSNIQLNTNTYFRKSQLDEIGSGGIDIMIQDATITQSIKSRHDLTTNMDAVEYREWSITKQADVAAKTLRNAIDPYVGRYNITPDLFKFIGQVCGIVSAKLVKDGIVKKLEVSSIKRDETISDKINITAKATVFVAANTYEIDLLVVSR